MTRLMQFRTNIFIYDVSDHTGQLGPKSAGPKVCPLQALLVCDLPQKGEEPTLSMTHKSDFYGFFIHLLTL